MPQRLRSAAHLLDEPASGLLGGTRSHEVLGLPGLAEGPDGAVTGAGQPTVAFQRLAQDSCQIGTFADAQVCRAQTGDAPAECLDLLPKFIVGRSTVHPPSPRRPVMGPDMRRINGTVRCGVARNRPTLMTVLAFF